MKYIILLLLIISSSTIADEYTLKVVTTPTLGDVDVLDSSINYSHTDTNDITRATLDSMTIMAIDDAGNTSDDTKLYILIVPKFEMELYIVPNPMEVVGGNVKEFTSSFSDRFNISMYGMDNKGAAIILLFDREIDEYQSTGRIRVFDAVGNSITNYIPIQFGTNTDGQDIGVCVWNGRNTANRIVGPSSYVVYIEVHIVAQIETDDGINEINNTYIKVVGVKYR